MRLHIHLSDGPGNTPFHTSEPCYNGGTYDGGKCICPDNLFYGPKCEFPVVEIPVKQITANVLVQASVKVTNRNYSNELNNTHSEEYKHFETEFKKKMREIYKDIPEYHDVEIFYLRPGSIIVDHEVIFEANITNNISIINATLENLGKTATDLVLDKLTAINNTENDCMNDLCFVSPPDPILGVTPDFSPEENCKTISNANYAAYYYANTSTGTLRCLSNCSSDNPDAITCKHGICAISLRGAQCNCTDLDLFWYLDSHCNRRFQKSEVGLGLGLAVLLVTSAILAFFLFRARQRKSTSR
nr:mucin-17-like [Pogona vitticeps]